MAKKRKKAKASKKRKITRKPKKRSGKKTAALVLILIAMLFLFVNFFLYMLTTKETILATLEDALMGPELVGIFSGIIITLAIIWIILVVLMAFSTYLVEKNRKRWYLLLIGGIIAIITLRPLAGILAITSSVLYKRA